MKIPNFKKSKISKLTLSAICFSGIDGSGKSSTISEVTEYLKKYDKPLKFLKKIYSVLILTKQNTII